MSRLLNILYQIIVDIFSEFICSRSREASEWDLEEKQLAERHHLNKQELKDRFYLQRTQMLARHQRVGFI